jgi:hypothetical protein
MIGYRSSLLLLCSLACACSTESDLPAGSVEEVRPASESGRGGDDPHRAEPGPAATPTGDDVAPGQAIEVAPDAGPIADDAGSASAPDASPLPDAGSTPNDKSVCIVTQFGLYEPMPVSWRETWDAATRVKSQHASEAADSPVKLAWHYDAQGRSVAYAGFGGGAYDNFQHDRLYDEHGNVKDFRLSYPSMPDVLVASTAAVWMGTSYANEYSAAGELLVTTATPYGPGNSGTVVPVRTTFRHDAQGRCQRIEGGYNDSVVTLSYDAAGQVTTHETELNTPSPFSACTAGTVTSYEYDAAGRTTRSTQRCRVNGARPIWVETHTYAADGSELIESFNYASDLVNDTMTIDGEEVRFAHTKESRTAGCALIEAAIAAQADAACHPL